MAWSSLMPEFWHVAEVTTPPLYMDHSEASHATEIGPYESRLA